jgi:hypothetical protein
MKQSNNLEINGNIRIARFDKEWNLISEDRPHNLVVSTGLDLIMNHLLSSMTPITPHHFILGTGTTAAASTDIALQTSAYNVSFTGSTVRPGGVTFNGSLYSTDGVGSTFKEIGIFTSSSQIIARALIANLVKTSSNPTNELISWAFDFIAST